MQSTAFLCQLGFGSTNIILLPITISQWSLLQHQLSIHDSTDVCKSNLFAKFTVMRNDNHGTVLAAPARQRFGKTGYATNIQVLLNKVVVEQKHTTVSELDHRRHL